ncbi:MAG TPA: peptidoglycan DD-metalloendopeptidase family protein [Gaiellaceae bacterium]
MRGLAFAAIGALLLAAPAAGDVYSHKHSVDARISVLHARADAAQQRAERLAAEIDSVNSRIHGLETRVGDVDTRLAALENDLALHRRKLDRLTELFRVQTRRYSLLRGQYSLALERLNARLVQVYERGDVTSLDVVLEARSLSDLIDRLEYVRQLASADDQIATSVGRARDAAREARAKTRKLRGVVAAETRAVQARTEQVRAVRDELLANRRELVSARSTKRVDLADVRASERQAAAESQALERVSAALGAQIQAAQAASSYSPPSSAPSASGFIWPVNGPVVSPFGMRWGRMHTGIDIGVSYGTPIHAAASGQVIYAGWMDGYGNLVFIDHGRGISTGYAHQSSIAVSNGQSVTQGQVIGYVGCTGHCFGPHLHFEVRVNGSPVDPLGYL